MDAFLVAASILPLAAAAGLGQSLPSLSASAIGLRLS